jgi:uncharacterized protein YdhG (YjbR/CyaY superfamily)
MEKAGKSITVTMDEYIEGFPADIQKKLQQIRTTIKKAAPGAEEKISYAIPTFTLNGNLVHFAAFKNHIGFYPAPSAINKFQKELAVYQGAKGSIQFPIEKPVPLNLITKIVKFRVKENHAKLTPVKRNKTKKNDPSQSDPKK